MTPQTNVEALLAAGEGPVVEFKRQLPESAEQKRKVLKTVAAFATGDGGTVVFGMDPDELTVTGLSAGDPKKLRDQLYDLVNLASADVRICERALRLSYIYALPCIPSTSAVFISSASHREGTLLVITSGVSQSAGIGIGRAI